MTATFTEYVRNLFNRIFGNRQALHCGNCGQVFNRPAGSSYRELVKLLAQFDRDHKNCGTQLAQKPGGDPAQCSQR